MSREKLEAGVWRDRQERKATRDLGEFAEESPRSTPNLWFHRSFALMWSAHTISQFGTQITFFVIPVIALTSLGASTTELGVLVAAESLPFLLFALPAGVWVDRWDRRTTLIVADVGRALALGSLPVAYFLDALSIKLLFGAAFLTGLLTVFFDIADQAYLPSVIAKEHIPAGNTRLEISRSTAELAGPGLGGLLIQWLAAQFVLLVDVVSYLVSALLLGGISELRNEKREKPERLRMWAEIIDGLRFVFGNVTLRAVAMCTAITNLFGLGGALSALLTVFAINELKLSAGTFGLMLTLGNAGALLGVSLSGRFVRSFGLGPVLVGSSAMSGLPMLLLAIAKPGAASALVAIAMALMAGGIAVYNINQLSLRQSITPTWLQGRMNASMRFAVWGTLPLGALGGGILGDLLGVRPMLWILGVLGLTACLPLMLTRQVRALREIPSEDPAQTACC